MKVYQKIAVTLAALRRCVMTDNHEWAAKHEETLRGLQDLLPSGSGFDAGTVVDAEASGAQKLVLHFGYHHMNSDGFYVGWTHYMAEVTPAFDGFDFELTLRESDAESLEMFADAKDYLEDTLHNSLDEDLL